MTGASEKTLQRTGKPFRKLYVHPANHAGYYPGAEQMTLKVLFDPQSGRVLGRREWGEPASINGSTCWQSPFRRA